MNSGKQPKIKFAIVGMGHIGKRHMQMIRQNPQAELVAVCDVKTPEECSLSSHEIPFFSSYEDMLSAGLEFDVVNVCTPNGLHASMSVLAMEKGAHVVIEKPMTLHKKDAEDILKTSFETGKHVFCVMQNRYSPPSVWLKDILKKNVLGEIYLVQINCYWNRDERYYTKDTWHGTQDLDGGTLFTQFSHFVDMMYWLFGDIENIKASFGDFNHRELTDFEDSGLLFFDFVEGGKGSFSYTTSVYQQNFESSLTIIAEKGTVKVAGQYMNELTYCNIKDLETPTLEPSNPPNDYGPYKGSAQNHHYVIQNVIDKLHSDVAITTNALEGMKVVDIIERIYAQKGTGKV